MRTKEHISRRFAIAVETLQQIATLPSARGGLAKRLAVSTLAFLDIPTPEPKKFKRTTCPVCGKNVCVSKRGWIRAHQFKGEWCEANQPKGPPMG